MPAPLGAMKSLSFLGGVWRVARTGSLPMFSLGDFAGEIAGSLCKDRTVYLYLGRKSQTALPQPKTLVVPKHVEAALMRVGINNLVFFLEVKLEGEAALDDGILTNTLTIVLRELAKGKREGRFFFTEKQNSSFGPLLKRYGVGVEIKPADGEGDFFRSTPFAEGVEVRIAIERVSIHRNGDPLRSSPHPR